MHTKCQIIFFILLIKCSKSTIICGDYCGKFKELSNFKNYYKNLYENSHRTKRQINLDYNFLDPKNEEFYYRIHIKAHLRKINESSNFKNSLEDSPTFKLSFALAHLFKHQDPLKDLGIRITWEKYITDISNRTKSCLGLGISYKFMIANKQCVDQFESSRVVWVMTNPEMKEGRRNKMIESISHIQGSFGSKYNFVLIKSLDDLWPAFLRPLCRKLGKLMLWDAFLNWIFIVKDEQGKVKELVTVAKILMPNVNECKEVLSNNDLICVKLETDLNQCNDKVQVLNPGYLTFFQGGERFFLIGIFSHGSKSCHRSESVTFFTRMDGTTVQETFERAVGTSALKNAYCKPRKLTYFQAKIN